MFGGKTIKIGCRYRSIRMAMRRGAVVPRIACFLIQDRASSDAIGKANSRISSVQPIVNPEETQYEKQQRFNPLVSWLHSFRYRNVLAVIQKTSRKDNSGAIRIVELGCAHAKLFSLLDQHFDVAYTGIETSSQFVEVARARYGHKANFQIVHDSAANATPHMENADVLLALETLEHIPEHDVVRIVEAIAAAKPGLFVCSVPVEIGPAVWLKNLGSLVTGYMRHREYRWSETFWAGLYQLDKLPPHGTGHKGFDWRWLAQTVRHNMNIIEIRRFPFGFLPAALAFSIFMIAEPREVA